MSSVKICRNMKSLNSGEYISNLIFPRVLLYDKEFIPKFNTTISYLNKNNRTVTFTHTNNAFSETHFYDVLPRMQSLIDDNILFKILSSIPSLKAKTHNIHEHLKSSQNFVFIVNSYNMPEILLDREVRNYYKKYISTGAYNNLNRAYVNSLGNIYIITNECPKLSCFYFPLYSGYRLYNPNTTQTNTFIYSDNIKHFILSDKNRKRFVKKIELKNKIHYLEDNMNV